MKYKVGDKVRVRRDLEVDGPSKYGCMYYTETMHDAVKEANGVVTIKELNNDTYYIEEYHHSWFTDEMFEGLVEEEKPTESTESTEPTPTPINITINVNVDSNHIACWYCRKGGIVDRLFDGTPGICPFCGRVVNMPNVMVVKHSEPTFNKFKVGDKVIYEGHTGTVICIAHDDDLGVEFTDGFGAHGCGGIRLKAGKPSNGHNCWWCNPKKCSPAKED